MPFLSSRSSFKKKKQLLYDCRHECGLNTDHITLAAVSLAPLSTPPTNHYLQPPAMLSMQPNPSVLMLDIVLEVTHFV